MATSGSKTVAVTSWNDLVFSWELASQNISGNTSTVRWYMKLVAKDINGRISSPTQKDWSVTVNGTQYSGTNTVGVSGYQTKTLASGTTTISHGTDGSKTFSYSFSQEFAITFSRNYLGTKSGTGSGTLPTIARASKPTITYPNSGSSCDFGQKITINTNRQSSSFTHTLRYAFGSITATIASNVGASYQWTIPGGFMAYLPNAVKGSGTIYVDTYSGSTKIGTASCGFTATVPANVKPTCSVTLTDTTGTDDIYGKPVKGLSQIRVKVNTTLAYASPIKSYSVSINGATYIGSDVTSDFLKAAGSSPVSVTVKDGRGRTASWSYTMTVLDYSPPKITKLSVHRCNEDGTENMQGEYIELTFSAAVTAMSNNNTASYSVQYKKTTDAAFTAADLDTIQNVYSVTNHTYIFPAASGSPYNVEVLVSDSHSTQSRSTRASTARCLRHWGADGYSLGLGKLVTKPGYMEVGFQMEVETPIEYAEQDKILLEWGANITGYSPDAAWCRKNAVGMVELYGLCKPINNTNLIGTDTGEVICTLPVGYRPGEGFYQLCQGSGGAMWLLSISSGGEVRAARYRNTSGYQTPTSSNWLPFHVTFFADH